ncbi:hypothetical protein Syun_010696 [Stephania yunnanensis]|uniref:Uncharacterized protein n=1 Tax=Stephania yunnanensis TaxID=152371 RepID=A0AAP0KJA7_9MAGN
MSSTLENLFVQIFDRKNWIVDQLKQQKELYDQYLASTLLIKGIRPPSWLLGSGFEGEGSAELKGAGTRTAGESEEDERGGGGWTRAERRRSDTGVRATGRRSAARGEARRAGRSAEHRQGSVGSEERRRRCTSRVIGGEGGDRSTRQQQPATRTERLRMSRSSGRGGQIGESGW